MLLENVKITLWNTQNVVTFESDLHWPQLRTELWTTGISWAWSFHQVVLPRNVADQEALAGKITYFPASRALPIKYFPYLVSSSCTETHLAYNNVEQYLVLFYSLLLFSFQAIFLTLSTFRARGTKSTRRLATTLPSCPSESQKPRQRVSNADQKVFANPESFCDKFIIGWRISGYFAIQNIQIICKVSGWTGKFPDNLKSVRII